MTAPELKVVVTILKKRFNNLGVEETVDIATSILAALDTVRDAAREQSIKGIGTDLPQHSKT